MVRPFGGRFISIFLELETTSAVKPLSKLPSRRGVLERSDGNRTEKREPGLYHVVGYVVVIGGRGTARPGLLNSPLPLTPASACRTSDTVTSKRIGNEAIVRRTGLWISIIIIKSQHILIRVAIRIGKRQVAKK